MTTAIRSAALAAYVLLASTASAQDLLTAGGRAFGAVARFGQDLGPTFQAPEDSIFGGRSFSTSAFVRLRINGRALEFKNLAT